MRIRLQGLREWGWPARLDGGREIDGVCMGTDWFPTILDWLELPTPADRIIDGRSLRSMVEDDDLPKPHREGAFSVQ